MSEKSVPNVNFFINYEDQSNSDKNTKYSSKRDFYSSNQNYDYVGYMNSGSKAPVDYVEYSGNGEKSKGLFSQNGLMNNEEIKALRKNLRTTKSVIWHGVISFTEEFGDCYCNTTEKAIKMMNVEFPKFLKKAGLNPDNVEWFAALHENTDNKHIHFSFYEKQAERFKNGDTRLFFSKGKIPLKAINNAKIGMELSLLYSGKEITKQRKILTEEVRNRMEKRTFENALVSLMQKLPKSGKFSYNSENLSPYRNEIDMLTNKFICSNKDIKDKFMAYESLLAKRDYDLIEAYKRINVDYSDKLLRNKTIDDLYRRIGNIILHSILNIKREDKTYSNRLIQKRIERANRKHLFEECLRLEEQVNKEIIGSFEEYLRKLDEDDYKRLIEEGVIE